MNDQKNNKTINLDTQHIEIVVEDALEQQSDATVSYSQTEIAAMTIKASPDGPVDDQKATMAFHTSQLDLKRVHVTEAPTEQVPTDAMERAIKKVKQTYRYFDASTHAWSNYLSQHTLPAHVIIHISDIDSLFYRLNVAMNPLLKANYQGSVHVYVGPQYRGKVRLSVLGQFYQWMERKHFTATHEYIMTMQSTWHEHSDGMAQLLCFEPRPHQPTKTQVVGNMGHTNADVHLLEAQCLAAMLSQRHTHGAVAMMRDHEPSPMVMQTCVDHQARAINVLV